MVQKLNGLQDYATKLAERERLSQYVTDKTQAAAIEEANKLEKGPDYIMTDNDITAVWKKATEMRDKLVLPQLTQKGKKNNSTEEGQEIMLNAAYQVDKDTMIARAAGQTFNIDSTRSHLLESGRNYGQTRTAMLNEAVYMDPTYRTQMDKALEAHGKKLAFDPSTVPRTKFAVRQAIANLAKTLGESGKLTDESILENRVALASLK